MAQALRRLGNAPQHPAQPSMGRVRDQGGRHGGHSQVVPMEEINLHFTATSTRGGGAQPARRLIDNHLHTERLGLDPEASLARSLD